MNIVKEEQNLMIIKDRNIFAFLIGIIFTLVGILVILKPDFFVNQPPSWSGVSGALLGIFIIIVVKITTISLNKMTGKLLFLWKTVLNKKIKEYDLNQVKEVELQPVYSSSRGRGGQSYRLVFILDNGEEVPLNPFGSAIIRVMGKQIITEGKIGARIAGFLNIPFNEKRSLAAKEILSSIQSAIQNAAEKEMEKHKKDI